MATILRADGSREVLDVPANGLTLDRMQALVGGYIEVVYLGGPPDRRQVLVVDEDGRRHQRPLNAAATALYRGHPPRHDAVIVGDAILAEIVDPGGDGERIV